MLLSSFTLLATSASLAFALPTSRSLNRPRAGGPAITPIPANCTVTDPTTSYVGSSDGSSFQPSPATADFLLYSSYYPAPSSNNTQLAQQCLEQCYGYGDHTECKAAVWANNVPVPKGYYGSPGGQLETACLLYTRALEDEDFEDAEEGQWTDVTVRDLDC